MFKQLSPHLFGRISAICDSKYGKQGLKFIYACKYVKAFTALIFTQTTITLHFCVHFFLPNIIQTREYCRKYGYTFIYDIIAITVNTVTLHADFLYRISHKYAEKC